MNQVIEIGNLIDDGSWNSPQRGRVYDSDGICPTLNTRGGGNAHIIVKTGGQASEENHRGGVYINVSEDFQRGPLPGLIRTLKANQHDAGVIERIAVASRGRNPENPSDRTAGSPTEQRLEPNTDSVTNTLTTVQKDNMVLEKVGIRQATAKGYIECEVGGVADFSYPNSKTRRGRVQEGGRICPTLMATEQEICKVEKNTEVEEYGYRIRKLVPIETWRLMSFTDEDFHKAESVVSNSQLYKQAGNSIVKNVLIAIFGQMIPKKENEYKKFNPKEEHNVCNETKGN